MPLVEFDLDEAKVNVGALVAQRRQRYEAEMMREYGPLDVAFLGGE